MPAPYPDTVLPDGVHVYFWDHDNGWDRYDAHEVAADLVELGVTSVLPHGASGMLTWLRRNVGAFRGAGLQVCPSLSYVRESTILTALDVDVGYAGGGRVSLDWEGWWDGRQTFAAGIVDKVLARVRDADMRTTDCPWWAPLYRITASGKSAATHPRAPTREFGRLCSRDRYPQCYGAPTAGRSWEYYQWAQHPSQYASLGGWTILPTWQSYSRSLNDCIQTLIRPRSCVLWEWLGMSANMTLALEVRRELLAAGYSGPQAVVKFQQAHPPLVVDGIVGPKTLGALGLG